MKNIIVSEQDRRLDEPADDEDPRNGESRLRYRACLLYTSPSPRDS